MFEDIPSVQNLKYQSPKRKRCGNLGTAKKSNIPGTFMLSKEDQSDGSDCNNTLILSIDETISDDGYSLAYSDEIASVDRNQVRIDSLSSQSPREKFSSVTHKSVSFDTTSDTIYDTSYQPGTQSRVFVTSRKYHSDPYSVEHDSILYESDENSVDDFESTVRKNIFNDGEFVDEPAPTPSAKLVFSPLESESNLSDDTVVLGDQFDDSHNVTRKMSGLSVGKSPCRSNNKESPLKDISRKESQEAIGCNVDPRLMSAIKPRRPSESLNIEATPIKSSLPAHTPTKIGNMIGDLGTPLSEVGSPAVLDVEGADFEAALTREGNPDPLEYDVYDSSLSRLVEQSMTSRRLSDDSFDESDCSNDISLSTSRSSDVFSAMQSVTRCLETSLDRSESSMSSKVSRPLPDQSAFDRSFNSSKASPMSSPLPVCPATPVRTPNWHEDSCGKSLRPNASGLQITRQNSLVSNKLLLSQSENNPSQTEISFVRDFESEGVLGSGTFADVYRAKDKRDGKSYAVKKSKRQFRSRKDREWLLNEVRTMKLIGQVHCDHIVHLVRAWQEGGYFYVQTDLADKGNLKDVINMAAANSNPLNYSTLWHIVHDVALGLEHIHNFGMVHLDIKPANLLIDESGRIKIGDFGMAVAQGSCEDGHEGDTRYLAGEILSSMSRDSPADIFSFGISMYEICLSGRRPFTLPAEGPCWQALRNGCGEPMHLEDDDLNNLVENMMAQDPQHRYRSDQIVALPKVKAVDGTVDPFLSSIDQQRPHNPLNRAFSFLPLQDIELAWNNGAVDGTGPDALLANSRMAVVTPTSELAVAMWKQQNMSRK